MIKLCCTNLFMLGLDMSATAVHKTGNSTDKSIETGFPVKKEMTLLDALSVPIVCFRPFYFMLYVCSIS